MILVTGVKSYLKIKLQEIRKYYPDWGYIEMSIKITIFICKGNLISVNIYSDNK